jgi:hypothetical protein
MTNITPEKIAEAGKALGKLAGEDPAQTYVLALTVAAMVGVKLGRSSTDIRTDLIGVWPTEGGA